MNVIAVDVGTTSVRLAIISFQGNQAQKAVILASHKKDIDLYQDGHKFEQSSSQIWQAVCECSRECIRKSGVSINSIKSIAFSATCSLVVVQSGNQAEKRDVIMWMDHRAVAEAQQITSGGSKVLNQFGGVCSPEFSLAKLLWLKQNEPDKFNSATGFFELPDWLVYRCIGGPESSCPRSLCCVTCKWGYDAENNCHCDMIAGLDMSKIAPKIGQVVLEPGKVAGTLCRSAALDLGLCGDGMQDKENLKPLDIVVGSSIIDAHSGMLAMLSVPLEQLNIGQEIETVLCSLAGTSTCHMLLSKARHFTQGIWGPYKNVVIDGYYLLEAGQSLTGRLIEICIESHQDGKTRLQNGEAIYDIIDSLNEKLEKENPRCDFHLLPSFHGSRTLANPRLLGGVYGLCMVSKSLLEYYQATIASLAYEAKFIVATLGAKLDAVLVSGGMMKNGYFMQTLADVLQCRTVKMSLKDVDFMVMGSGLIARHAALSILNTSRRDIALTRDSINNLEYDQLDCRIYQPRIDLSQYHDKRYQCYKEFVELSLKIDRIMNLSDNN